MQEKQTTLAVEIQARLSKVLGIEEAKNDLERFTESIKEQPSSQDIFEQARQTDLYQENLQRSGLKPVYHGIIKSRADLLDEQMEDAQGDLSATFTKILDDAETYKGQTIPRRVKQKWERWINKSVQEAEDIGVDYESLMQGARTESEKELIEQEKLVADQARQQFIEKTRDQAEAFKELIDGLDKTTTATEGLVETIKKLGFFALGAQVGQFAMQYGTLQAQIGARYQSAFDLTSPINNFSENIQAQLFERTQEREMGYRGVGGLIGGGIGGILGAIPTLGFGVGAGIAGGVGIGQMIGGWLAGVTNIEEQGQVAEFLKFLGQTAGIGESAVNADRGYSIGELTGEVRYGDQFRGRKVAGYGIAPQEELAYKAMFGDSLRGFDEDLFEDQTLFARQFRLDPSSIYQMNQLTRFTGERIGSQQLSEGRDLAQRIYGEDASTERTIDVLKAIKDINMQMLRFDEKADFETSRRIAELPGLIMGKDSPYGKIAEMGMDTIGALQGLGQGQDPISQVMLYQAYGEADPINYMRRMQRGFLGKGGENAKDIFSMLRRIGQIDPYMAEMYLLQMIPNADINEELSGIFTSKDSSRYDEIQNALSEKGADVKDVLDKAGIKVDSYEREQEIVQQNLIASGKALKETFIEMHLEASKYQRKLSESEEVQDQLRESMKKTFEFMDERLANWGIEGTEEKIIENVKEKAVQNISGRSVDKNFAKFLVDNASGETADEIIKNIVATADQQTNLPDNAIKNLTTELKEYLEEQREKFADSRIRVEVVFFNEDNTPANVEVKNIYDYSHGR